jgi:hypothetical protein
MPNRHSVLFAACMSIWPGVLLGQALHGRVLDTATRQPLVAVELKLMQGERVVANTTSDSLGRFTLRTGSEGSFHIAASRIGYADAKTQPVALTANQMLAVELLMSVTAVPVTPLIVEAPRNPYLVANGFYERMRTSNGFYMTEAEIDKRSNGNIVSLLRSARGVKVQRVNSREELYITSPSCLPQIVVDGVTVRWGGAIGSPTRGSAVAAQPLEDLVKVAHIEAIEVYRAFNGLPPQYAGPNAHCGTILIWTRHR